MNPRRQNLRRVADGLLTAEGIERPCGQTQTAVGRRVRVELEPVGCHSEASEFPHEISPSSVATGHGSPTVMALRDDNDRRAHEQAAEMAREVAEDERIATHLCDETIQRLFRSGLKLSSALSSGRIDQRTDAQLRQVIEELDDAIREIRTVVFTKVAPPYDYRPGPFRTEK
jgi:signal transduction histidine kinase